MKKRYMMFFPRNKKKRVMKRRELIITFSCSERGVCTAVGEAAGCHGMLTPQ